MSLPFVASLRSSYNSISTGNRHFKVLNLRQVFVRFFSTFDYDPIEHESSGDPGVQQHEFTSFNSSTCLPHSSANSPSGNDLDLSQSGDTYASIEKDVGSLKRDDKGACHDPGYNAFFINDSTLKTDCGSTPKAGKSIPEKLMHTKVDYKSSKAGTKRRDDRIFSLASGGSYKSGKIPNARLNFQQHGKDETDQEGSMFTSHPILGPDDIYVPVEAFFIARSVDLKGLSQEPFVNGMLSRNHLIIRCQGLHEQVALSVNDSSHSDTECLANARYIVVFQYGTAVLFNFGAASANDDCLKVVKRYCKDLFKEPRKDSYGVLVRPDLEQWSQGGPDKIMVKKLDMDGIRIISLVLSQSIALDHYTRGIDEMLNSFGELNRHMELTGTFSMKRKPLFRLVAAANTALADAILRLGLLERSDVAWQNAKYDRIWEYMRDDFELDDRFESLEFKTGIIQHNVKFFLDILQNRKSDSLEWIIIFLIAVEICIGVYEILHGAGAV